VFGIYVINRFTDIEDIINNPEKRLFFTQHSFLLPFAIILISGSTLLLLVSGKFTLFHLILIICGITYSVKLIPYFSKNKTIRYIRIKDIPYAKTLVLSLLWGNAFFVINWLVYPASVTDPSLLVLIIISWTIQIIMNTLFSDIRDCRGDKAVGVRTIPVVLGIKRTYVYFFILPGVLWFFTIIYLLLTHTIPLGLGILFFALLFYPLVYVAAFYAKRFPKTYVDFLIESDIIILSVGLIVLSVIR
jgi:4-hydroxybenzoate polyprenyltransferase